MRYLIAATLAAACALLSWPAQAADPVRYTVQIAPTGQPALDAALKASSQLQALRSIAPVGPFALIARAQQDLGRLQTALHSFGYYRPRILIRVNGHALNDPALPQILKQLPAAASAAVAVRIQTGPLYHLGSVRIEGEVDAQARAAFALRAGAPAVASDVLAARVRLRDALQAEGYALAKVAAPLVVESASAPQLDVTYRVDRGPKLDIGPIRFVGLKRMHAAYLHRMLPIHSGERYDPAQIARARLALLGLGVFSAVSVQSAAHADAQGRLPLTFDVQERPRHTVGVAASYSSDLGGSATTTWSDHNLFGNAEQLNLSASVINLGGTATQSVGYNATAQLRLPGFRRSDQALQFDLAALRQYLDAYDQTAQTGQVSLRRRLSALWSSSVGVTLEREHILQDRVPVPGAQPLTYVYRVDSNYLLLGVPFGIAYDSTGLTNPLQGATHGARATLSVAPTESLGHNRRTFFVVQVNASAYFDLAHLGWARPGRSVIAARGLLGSLFGAAASALPPDQRFYGGGSATVRGYRYQSIGPLFQDGEPKGGAAVDAASIELRQRLWGPLGMVAFVDAGQVSPGTRPFAGRVFFGAGGGVLYYTPIGPIRADVALPVTPLRGEDAFEIYIGLGQAF